MTGESPNAAQLQSISDPWVRQLAGLGRVRSYPKHTVFITEGEGEIEDKATGEVHQLRPGSIYVLNNHDKHQVRPKTDMKTICVFNPPVTGREVHDEDGVYPLVTEED